MSARKPASDRQRRGTRAVGDTGGVVVPFVLADRLNPAPSESWDSEICDEWETFWASDVGGLCVATDIPAVRRLFSMRRTYDMLMADYEESPFTAGSMGQLKTNPALDKALKFAPQIATLESNLALTTRARLSLGLDVVNIEEKLRKANQGAVASKPDPKIIELIEQAE